MLFRHKYLADGTLSRYKARLVANGSTQLEGDDVDETFSLVVKPDYYFLTSGVLYDGFRAHMVNYNPSRTPIDTESKMGIDCDPVSDSTLYRSPEGSLQYLNFTRPDISYAVQQVCLYMHDPREPHFSALKRILRYVRGTLDYGLQLFSSSTTNLVAYSDADWVGCPTTRRSTSVQKHSIVVLPMLLLRLVDCTIYWISSPKACFRLVKEFRISLSARCPPALTVWILQISQENGQNRTNTDARTERCMRTRNSYFPNNSSATIPRRQNKRRTPNVVEPELRTIVQMADNRMMEELLQTPTEGDNASKSDDRIDKLADQISTLVDIFAKKIVTPASVKAVEESCVTCRGNHAHYNCPNTDSNQPSVCVATGTYNQVAPQNRASNFMTPPGFAPNQSSTSGTLSSNTIPNPKGEMKAITTRSGVAYEGPSIPTLKKVMERETEETKDKEQSNFQGSTAHIQPPVTLISEPDVPKTLPKPNIRYPSRLNDQKLREKATNQMEKFFQIFQDLHFDISFTDALLLMPKFASTIKSLLTNKDKLFELAKIPLNENCSAMLLKNLPEKLGDPGKFLIPCDFPRMDVCHALANLGASINLMSLSIWKKLSLPELTPTRMTLELADRSITRPKGVAEDVFVKVGKFHFSTDFVVVDFEVDPRVPLILGRSFLRTGLNRIDIIDVYREEYAQEILGFSSNSLSGNPTSTFEPILFYSSPSLTPFEGSDFILEEINAYLKNESILSEIDHADCDLEGDICLIEKLLNNDPFQLLPMDLKQGEAVKAKSSIEEPPELELKELPSHLEYAYLEGVDKLPVIILKDLKVDDKEALVKVLKSHKMDIAWKITNIEGINPRFCTHKILMEEDYKPVVQSQRRVNPKTYEVIKKEVIKFLDAGMIYPISDSP
nr:reverse transcriptase domain-containing protein [Tanacetum cinerariifolium]